MSSQTSQHAKGLALTAFGGLCLTFDIPLIKLASGDPWPILLVRSGMTLAAALLVWLLWRTFGRNAPALVPGRTGVLVATLYGLSSVFFLIGVYNTTTANLVFILALNTMFAGLLGWLFLGERPRSGTLLAMAAMLLGVLIIVGDSIGTGNLVGDAAAVTSTLFIAIAITVTRRSGKEMGFASLVGVALPLVLSVAMVVSQSSFRIDVPWWIVFNGAVVIPVAFYCLATGPKYLSAPEVAMFYLLETILAPVWVWLIFSEEPSTASLIGGTIMIVALIAHSVWQLWSGRTRRSQGNLRHPA